MPSPRAASGTAPRRGRGRRLHGASGEQMLDRAVVELRTKTHREKSRNWQHKTPQLKAAAADPDLHRLAARLDELTATEHDLGGRPRMFPTWLLLVYGVCIHICGSSLQAQGNLADPDVLAIVYKAASPLLPDGSAVPARGPERHHWDYFLKARMAPHRAKLIETFSRNAAELARDMGLADPDTASHSNLDRSHVVLIDGKVLTSPQGWRETKFEKGSTKPRIEPKARRSDPARSQHGEAGGRLPYGVKYGIPAMRSPLPNCRVVLGLAEIRDGDGRGEGGPFTDLALDIAARLPGVAAFITDGALRGEHIDAIQRGTGASVVNRPPRLKAEKGAIKVGDSHHRARVVPESKARTNAFRNCDGHDLLAAGGRLFERVRAVDGSDTFHDVRRVRNKRDRLTDGSYRIYALHELPCTDTGEIHTWWEPLTKTDHDTAVKFNRAEYLRVLPIDDPEFARVYGYRNDIESLNNQLEHGFHKQRIPAWGEPNQTCVLLLALLGQNAYARQAWAREVEYQAGESPPDAA